MLLGVVEKEVGFRLATGSEDGITSTNQTMTGSFDLKEFSVDRAYAKYSPKQVEGLTVIGGKMANPFFHTDMVWDSDVNPEGVWAIFKCPGKGPVRPFAGIGIFIIDENSSAGDAEVHVYEAGATWLITEDIKWTSAATYYDYGLYEKAGNFATPGNNTTSGGLLSANDFNVINLTNKVSWTAFDLPMKAYFDYARNCGDDTENMDDAFAVGIKVGKNKKQGDWSVSFKYAYIEANALPGAFPDADFGGTDRKGTVWRAKYNLTDAVSTGLSLFCTESIDDIDSNSSEFIAQADLVWKF